MANPITTGAMLSCTFGAAPSVFNAVPMPGAPTPGTPVATIMQTVPIANIPPFGMCSSPNNPAVISATAAASGVFTPQPCMPVIPMPWAPPSVNQVAGNMPLATTVSKCMCAWAGMIAVTAPAPTCMHYKTTP